MTAIVTGGAQGIGASICDALLKNGYKVCVADIQEPKGLQFVEEQQKIYGAENVTFSLCDVRKESDFTRTFDQAISAFQTVDLLVNNAGVIARSPKEVIDVNLMGPIIGCQTALKYIGKSNGGKGGMVINIASISGLIPQWSRPLYSISKHGVVGLTRCYGFASSTMGEVDFPTLSESMIPGSNLPEHEKRDGVIFAALCPGLTKTDLLDASGEDYPHIMSPDYVAQGVMKLMEDRINGSTLVVTKALGYRYVECQKEIDNTPLV